MYLVDTMVLSERSKARAAPQVLDWLRSVSREQVFVSVVRIGEIERGIHKLERREARPATRHKDWLNATLGEYGPQILPITLAVARRWGPLTHRMGRSDPDLLIAATALEHGLTLVTRNVRHFEPTGVKLLDPYRSTPA